MLRRFWKSTAGLAVVVALIFALATVTVGAIAYQVTHEALEEQFDHRVAVETAGILAEPSAQTLNGLMAAIGRRQAARSESSLHYLLVDAKGRRLAGTMTAEQPIRVGYEELFAFRDRSGPGIAQVMATPVAGGLLVVGADRRELDGIDRILATLFGGTFAAILILGIGASAAIGWFTRRRFAQIDATAQAIIAGDLSRRIPRDDSGSEFDNLAGTLNHMLDRIAGLMDNLRQLSSDVAHDLRTPLTRLCSRLDAALAAPAGGDTTAAIEAARAQAGELLEIFAALLRISEVEGMAERLPRELVDLSKIADQMVETYQPDIETSGRMLRSVVAPGISVRGDRRLLAQAMTNLLDNALRHTPEGSIIEVALQADTDSAILTISDDGHGIPVADRGRIFQRFARSERARSTPGHGLGLALVAAIAGAHGGRAALHGQTGFAVQVTLPLPHNRQRR
ncbi:HAMP domain-containing sensor histidine kinase [Sphingomonas montanisoli]|uniref:histidine kinase n=1 Tax=Sphingomonas montanisoli TaxID=2606412 RepID=A0A5D9C6H7_9SPHN|nr:ATP-binding protein [Sphingomonas montanisoli]TZG27133.1 HAMP domain-containing protein [Sphingomonas montanisoli]